MADTPVEQARKQAGQECRSDFSTFPNQIFWLVVTLVVIYLILSRVALPRIGAQFWPNVRAPLQMTSQLPKNSSNARLRLRPHTTRPSDARSGGKIVAQTRLTSI
jgi:F-type H+-transporting ATPase subunit b